MGRVRVYELSLECCDDCDDHVIWIATDRDIVPGESSDFYNLREIDVHPSEPGVDLYIGVNPPGFGK